MKSFLTHHPDEWAWRAYLDAELPTQLHQEMTAHLTACARCRTMYLQVQQTASFTAIKMGALRGAAEVAVVPPQHVLDRTDHNKEDSSFMARIPPRWVAAAAAALVATSLLIPSVRATAAEWLTVFRAQEAQVVTINLGDLGSMATGAAERRNASMAGGQITTELLQRMSQLVQVQVIRNEEQQGDLSFVEVQSRGFVSPTYLPAGFLDAVGIGKGASSSERLFMIDIEGANAILALMGSKDLLPTELKGEALRVVQGPSTAFTYRGNDQELVVLQSSSPEISASGKVDLNQILATVIGGLGSQFGLPTDLSDQLLAMDLSRTIPLPLIQGISEEIKVNGATGAYYQDSNQTAVIWVRNGRVYAVFGTLARTELLKVADSIGG